MEKNIDTSICPLCKKTNCCEVTAEQGCWCMNTEVPSALLAVIPEEFKGLSCVCNDCIKQYQQQLFEENVRAVE